jgi:hypothetical protein
MIARASHEGALKNNGRFLIAFTKEQTIEKHATELGWKLIEQPFHCITLGV